MPNSSENRNLEFFALTQSEFFLIVIFIILSYSIFQLGNLKDTQAQSKHLHDANQKMTEQIKGLGDSLRSLMISKAELDSLKRFKNTGIGNCLGEGKGFLAELSIKDDDLLSLEFFWQLQLEGIDINSGSIRTFNRNQFANFGQAVLNFSRSRVPECRFSIRIRDSDRVTKQQLKDVYLLCNRYFNALITQ